MTQAHGASAVTSRQSPASNAALAIALGSVGAGLLAVATLIHGLMTLGQSPDATLWSVGGLFAYLAVWGWGMVFARRS